MTADGFARTPLADEHFLAVFGHVAAWSGHDGVAIDWLHGRPGGTTEQDVAALPPGLPAFRYGVEDGTPYLKVEHRAVIYVRHGEARRVLLLAPPPEAVSASIEGRRLDAVVDLGGIGHLAVDATEDGEGVMILHLGEGAGIGDPRSGE